MVTGMDKNIWEHFNETPLDPKEARVIGVDFGAGEMTACYIINRESINLKDLSENLCTDNNNSRYTYTIYNDRKNIVGKECLSYPDEIYTNIKTTPENAKKNYGNIQGVRLGEHTLSYKDLQKKTFGSFIQDVLRYNEHILQPPKSEVYLFVGCPASSVWEEQAKDYQNILKEGLSELRSVKQPNKGEIELNFHIIVYSEAEAAMAYEYKKGNVRPNEIILIIDGGSSTFDCVVVKDGKVINEYSRQVGAGMIEQNLFDLCILDEKTAKQDVSTRKTAHDNVMRPQNPLDKAEGFYTVRLRQIKEDFYGTTGNAEQTGVISFLNQGNPTRKIIDSKVMDIAINKMPVRVERSYLDGNDQFGGNSSKDYDSFREAVEDFFKGAKARCFDRKTGEKVEIDRIILTGGATIMPFVQDIAKKVFEVEKKGITLEKPGDDRHYSVSNGLAYMGYVELTKSNELKKLKNSVHKTMEEIRPNIDRSILKSCTDKIWQECYIDQINQWVKDSSAKTLQKWSDIRYHIPFDAVRNDVSNLLEKEKVVEQINEILDTHFHQLFPQKGLQYQYNIQRDDILTAFIGQLPSIDCPLKNMLSLGQKLLKKINLTTELTQKEKEKIQKNTKNNKNAIRKDLWQQITVKTEHARKQIYNTMLHGIDESLEVYMESLTPYFVKGGE